jgi:hypothetical protein
MLLSVYFAIILNSFFFVRHCQNLRIELVKTKRQANFKDFKRFGAFKGLVEQKHVFNSFVGKLGLFFCTSGPIYTQTR